MSQVSKKPVCIPVRKRLKPTVNLNVASRRRKDAKEAPPVTDVSTEVLPKLPDTKNNRNEETVTHHNTNDRREEPSNSKESDNVLNTTYESVTSFSSEKTLLLQDYLQHAQKKNDKSQHDISVPRNSPSRSVSSSVTTVLLQNENISKQPLKDLLEQSIDSLDELDGFGASNVTENDSSMSSSCKTVDETADSEMLKMGNASKHSIISHAQRSGTLSDQTIHDQEKNAEAAAQVCDHSSRISVSSDVALPLSGRNVDLESLNDDSVSSVSLQNDLRQSFDMAPPKYKRKLSSMAKRLSDARRDFETRYCDKKPERSALRMFDLIYYNPSTNPMKSTADKPKEVVVSSTSDNLDSTCAIEEDVDNPAEEENSEGENENGIPAPRVKVGPNGEIVLDEQSLVIETTQSKKSRQEIANLTVVVDTGSNTTYHTYSKKKRARNEWSVKETIRFYKALQTLGTDFSLMKTLFPSRSRLDLKSKFKKEERINGHLIEKALRFPSLFDLSELEKEQVVEENKKSSEKKRKVPKQRVKKRSLKSLGFDEDDVGPPVKNKKKKGVKSSRPNQGKDTGKENVETQHNERTSDEEYQPPATEQGKNEGAKEVTERRSSRVLNGKALNYAAVENKHDFLEAGVDLLESSETEEENDPENVVEDCEEVSPTIASNFEINNVQPGSLVIVTTQHPDNPGYQICNVFMVQERTDRDSVVPPNQDFSSTQSNAPGTPLESTESVTEPS